ncbi:hypothetical protein MCOR06_008295 [Pyricularia oryzae]|uniref:Uncharacterized protein n=1 Tax=Pyricularia oryzae TaxID=318829 RepID=A0A4P7N4S1_PYROR|nr:hypothetical protein MCOR16_002167 [Pyricularia oryzae]KAI6582943.1 hypothetical protein MCOR06_008295 [Pyricularia oryzae]QBZ54960.1 hypothetical protein PoMZ_10675 [Pyricularia oryzae]
MHLLRIWDPRHPPSNPFFKPTLGTSYWRQNIKIEEDPELPQSKLISIGDTDPAIIGQLRKTDGQSQDGVQRVHVQGRVYRVAKQGGLMFATLRRGLDLMQRLFAGNLAKTYDALTLARETSVEVFGGLCEVPAGLRAPLDRELHGDYFRIIAKAPEVMKLCHSNP